MVVAGGRGGSGGGGDGWVLSSQKTRNAESVSMSGGQHVIVASTIKTIIIMETYVM